jgi:hypothetical protein
VPESWFLFVQLEIPWELGPADGRYLLRGGAEREPEHVVVLNTLGAARKRERGLRAGRGREVAPGPGATAVPVTRVTVIDPVPVSTQAQAKAWLHDLDPERGMWAAAGVVNRVLLAQRAAAADPYLHELSPMQALVVRAGWGVGEQVAEGQWEYARELPRREKRKRRVLALRPQERLTWLLGGREKALLCEELALRARRDVDQGRSEHAAVELKSAYAAALVELNEEGRQDLALRVAELRELSATIPAGTPSGDGTDSGAGSRAGSGTGFGTGSGTGSSADSGAGSSTGDSEEQTLLHALERLEAALRARSAGLKLG